MPQMSLTSITTEPENLPPRVVVYGPHGIGKTTLGASTQAPIFLRTEDGLAALRVPKFPMPQSYGDVMAALGELYSNAHPYQTLVIDTLDKLESLVWAHTTFMEGKQYIEDFDFGKGYLKALEHWSPLLEGLDALRAKGMTILLLAHAEIKRFDAPDTEAYDRYQIRLHKRAAELIQDWADVIMFAHYEVNVVSQDAGFGKKVQRGTGIGRRLLATEERPAFHAKNRYALPPLIPLSWKSFLEACAPAFEAPAAPAIPTTESQAEPAGALIAEAPPTSPMSDEEVSRRFAEVKEERLSELREDMRMALADD